MAAWLLKHGKRDKEWLALLQDATPAFLSKWFSLRETTVWLFQVLSKADWDWLEDNKNHTSLHKLWFGLFVIVEEDGYRLVKRENKGRSGDGYRATTKATGREVWQNVDGIGRRLCQECGCVPLAWKTPARRHDIAA